LRDDRTIKQRIYANAGIPQYVIINLPDRVVEVYTQPLVGKGRYGQAVTLGPAQSVVFHIARGRELKVAVRRLLP
jgi:Uma2 family endonuclease